MAVGSLSGVVPRSFVPARMLLPRVGQITLWPRSDATQPQGDRSGDRAQGPQVRLFDAIGSILPTQQNFESLLAFSQRLASQSAGSLGRYAAALRGLDRLDQKTSVLQLEIAQLLDSDGLSVNRVASDAPAVRAQAGLTARIGFYGLRVLQPARGHRIASDPQEDPLSPLGLEGTLDVEGEAIALTAGDSLAQLAAAINEAFESDEAGVQAEIDPQGRLVLERSPAGPQPIHLRDEDSIATALGLLEADDGGGLSVAHELVAPQAAIVETEGEQRTYASNQITGLFEGLELELLPDLFPRATDVFGQTSEQPVEASLRVRRDIEPARQSVLRFVETYNRTLRTLNEELLYSGSLEGDRSLAAARTRLIRAVAEPVPAGDNGEEANTVEDIGLQVRRARRSEVSELTLRRLGQLDPAGRPPSPLAAAGGSASILRNLGSIGVRQTDDGTLQVDLARLAQSLREQPARVGEILRDGQRSVLPRLQEQVGRLRDSQTGILARRRRLFEGLQERSRQTAGGGRQADRGEDLHTLLEVTSAQSHEIQAFLGGF